jgi:hypothetical protein
MRLLGGCGAPPGASGGWIWCQINGKVGARERLGNAKKKTRSVVVGLHSGWM